MIYRIGTISVRDETREVRFDAKHDVLEIIGPHGTMTGKVSEFTRLAKIEEARNPKTEPSVVLKAFTLYKIFLMMTPVPNRN